MIPSLEVFLKNGSFVLIDSSRSESVALGDSLELGVCVCNTVDVVERHSLDLSRPNDTNKRAEQNKDLQFRSVNGET